jgi:hypothetical protein
MNFDELWRLNLAIEQGSVYSIGRPEAVDPAKSSSELVLTAEDLVFLSQVGIRL